MKRWLQQYLVPIETLKSCWSSSVRNEIGRITNFLSELDARHCFVPSLYNLFLSGGMPIQLLHTASANPDTILVEWKEGLTVTTSMPNVYSSPRNVTENASSANFDEWYMDPPIDPLMRPAIDTTLMIRGLQHCTLLFECWLCLHCSFSNGRNSWMVITDP